MDAGMQQWMNEMKISRIRIGLRALLCSMTQVWATQPLGLMTINKNNRSNGKRHSNTAINYYHVVENTLRNNGFKML